LPMSHPRLGRCSSVLSTLRGSHARDEKYDINTQDGMCYLGANAIASMSDGRCLMDSVIDCYVESIYYYNPNPQVLVAPIYFTTLIFSVDDGKKIKMLERLEKKHGKSIFEFMEIHFPVLSAFHYFTLSIVVNRNDQGSITSLEYSVCCSRGLDYTEGKEKEFVRFMAMYWGKTKGTIAPFRQKSTLGARLPSQGQNASNCGVFTAFFLERMIRRTNNVEKLIFNNNAAREYRLVIQETILRFVQEMGYTLEPTKLTKRTKRSKRVAGYNGVINLCDD